MKKLKETLPLLASCLVVLGVGIASFSLTKTDAALISDNITPPPAQDLEAIPEVTRKIAPDEDYTITSPTNTDYTVTTGLTYAAPVFVADDNVELDGTFLNDVFVAGNTVTLRGHINGDVFVAGSNVTVLADVGGDVFVAGANISITGAIKGDVRVAGSEIMIDHHVGGNVQAFGETIDITENAQIGQELMLMAGTVTMSGHVAQDIVGQVRQLDLYGSVEHDVMLTSIDKFIMHNQASIGGNVDYSAQHMSTISQDLVGGQVTYHQRTPDQPTASPAQRFWSGWFVAKLMIGLIGYVLLGLICLRLMSSRLLLISQRMRSQPFASFGWGVLYFMLLPLVVLITAITLIGLPLSGAILLVALLLLLLAKLSVGLAFGQLLLPKAQSMYGQFILGFVLFYLPLQLLSHSGFILHSLSAVVWAVALCWSTGAMLKQWKQHHD